MIGHTPGFGVMHKGTEGQCKGEEYSKNDAKTLNKHDKSRWYLLHINPVVNSRSS